MGFAFAKVFPPEAAVAGAERLRRRYLETEKVLRQS